MGRKGAKRKKKPSYAGFKTTNQNDAPPSTKKSHENKQHPEKENGTFKFKPSDCIYPIGSFYECTTLHQHWLTLESKEQFKICSITEKEIYTAAESMFRHQTTGSNIPSYLHAAILDDNISITSDAVMTVQGRFLHGMVYNAGGIIVEAESNPTEMSILHALERNLMISIRQSALYLQLGLIVLYFILLSPYPITATIVYAFIMLGSYQSNFLVRDKLAGVVDYIFVQGDIDPISLDWKLTSYLNWILLVYHNRLVNDYDWKFIPTFMVTLPFIVKFFESRENEGDLDSIKKILSFINSIMLLYFVWESYLALALVGFLLFPSFTFTAATYTGIAILFCGSIVLKLLLKTLPVEGIKYMLENNPVIKWVSSIVILSTIPASLWYTTSYTGVFFTVLKIIYTALACMILPTNVIVMILNGIMFVCMILPLRLLDSAIGYYSRIKTYLWSKKDSIFKRSSSTSSSSGSGGVNSSRSSGSSNDDYVFSFPEEKFLSYSKPKSTKDDDDGDMNNNTRYNPTNDMEEID